jgi:hypothetical protein
MNDDDDNMSIILGHGTAASDTITMSIEEETDVDVTLQSYPPPTFTIKNATPYKPNPFDDIFGRSSTETKESVVHDLDIDPLAAIIELKAGGQFPAIELIKRHVPNKETVELAQTVREYFLDKVITQKLSGQFRDSDFKRDMVKALKLSAKCVLEEPHIRLLYRMDDFYKEDTFKERIAAEYTTLPNRDDLVFKSTPVSYIGSIDIFRRGSKTKEFYFKTDNNYVVVLKSLRSDWLLPVTAVFDHVKQLWLSADARPVKIREHEFVIAELGPKYTVDNFVF